jgi:rhodanese-related sulfurtransferase
MIRLWKLVFVVALLSLPGFAIAAEKGKEGYSIVNSAELKALVDKNEPGLVLIDARTSVEFQEVHIKGAVNIPEPELSKDVTLLKFPKESKLVFYCNGVKCGKSKKAAIIALGAGYRDVTIYGEGMPVWEEKGYSIYAGPAYEKKVETTILKPQELKAILDSKPTTVTLVDVRDSKEFSEGHIAGAINIPVEAFAAGSGVLEKDKQIIVYCNSGGRSYNAYRKLQKLAYPNIRQAIYEDWKDEKLPVVTGK